jgi:Mn-dependent DtxR family transcriptional regulator
VWGFHPLAKRRACILKIQESAENYLEAILMIQREKGNCRSIDVAQFLGFSKPSVSRAMSLLRENGYVVMDNIGLLTLTESGREIAERIFERHQLLTEWLIRLGVSPETAQADACRIEHVISVESFDHIKKHISQTD